MNRLFIFSSHWSTVGYNDCKNICEYIKLTLMLARCLFNPEPTARITIFHLHRQGAYCMLHRPSQPAIWLFIQPFMVFWGASWGVPLAFISPKCDDVSEFLAVMPTCLKGLMMVNVPNSWQWLFINDRITWRWFQNVDMAGKGFKTARHCSKLSEMVSVTWTLTFR